MLGSVETRSLIRAVSVCDQRTPRVSITTMYSAPVARRIRSASACTGPDGSGRVLSSWSTRPGSAAVVWAMERARRIAWSSSSWLSGARKSPVTSMTTPVVIATWVTRTWAKTRRGQ